MKKLSKPFFLSAESASGLLLLMMAVLALIWINSPGASSYVTFVNYTQVIINDGLMVIFFLLIGLELKRSYIEGQLTPFNAILLPAFAAIGGMIVPALLYLLLNRGETSIGWAIPVATDIAFALAILSLFGPKVPKALRLFLLLLAIFDDIGAILIIAFWHSEQLAYLWLLFALITYACLWLLNYWSVRSLLIYSMVGCILWLTVYKSGIHPTVAGVVLAFTIPHQAIDSPLYRFEHFLQPIVNFFIMPLFALANAGVPVLLLTANLLTQPIFLGIVSGLFIGKPLGIFGACVLLISLKLTKMPQATDWLMLLGVAIISGIGFTMSLFLGTLSFSPNAAYLAQVRLGVLTGSLLSGLVGAFILLFAFERAKRCNLTNTKEQNP